MRNAYPWLYDEVDFPNQVGHVIFMVDRHILSTPALPKMSNVPDAKRKVTSNVCRSTAMTMQNDKPSLPYTLQFLVVFSATTLVLLDGYVATALTLKAQILLYPNLCSASIQFQENITSGTLCSLVCVKVRVHIGCDAIIGYYVLSIDDYLKFGRSKRLTPAMCAMLQKLNSLPNCCPATNQCRHRCH